MFDRELLSKKYFVQEFYWPVVKALPPRLLTEGTGSLTHRDFTIGWPDIGGVVITTGTAQGSYQQIRSDIGIQFSSGLPMVHAVELEATGIRLAFFSGQPYIGFFGFASADNTIRAGIEFNTDGTTDLIHKTAATETRVRIFNNMQAGQGHRMWVGMIGEEQATEAMWEFALSRITGNFPLDVALYPTFRIQNMRTDGVAMAARCGPLRMRVYY